MKATSKTGAAIAAAAATLFLSGVVGSAATPTTALVSKKCAPNNICRSACKGKVGAAIRKAQSIALAECIAARKIKAKTV